MRHMVNLCCLVPLTQGAVLCGAFGVGCTSPWLPLQHTADEVVLASEQHVHPLLLAGKRLIGGLTADTQRQHV